MPFRVLIVGAGLGGLACAIGCSNEGFEVTVLEQTAELSEVDKSIWRSKSLHAD
jgi:salicylate hydroxylase